MLLTSTNLGEIKYKTKRVHLEKADAEINVALIPVSLVNEAKEKLESGEIDSLGLEILQAAVIDDEGKPVFETAESYESLPVAIQEEIMNAVWDYNGLTEVGPEKNSKAT